MKIMKIFFCLLSVAPLFAWAQIDIEPLRRDNRSIQPVIYETFSYETSDTTMDNFIVLYRINASFFFFVKGSDNQQNAYIAQGEFVIEIIDETNTTVARNVRTIQLMQNAIPSEEHPSTQDVQGACMFTLKKGAYHMVIEAKDTESKKSYLQRNIKIGSRSFTSHLKISSPVFTQPMLSDSAFSTLIYPINQGGNVIIGQPGSCFLQVTSADTMNKIHLSWKITNNRQDDKEIFPLYSDSVFLEKQGTLELKDAEKEVSFIISKGIRQIHFLTFSIPFEQLDEGRYTLIVSTQQDTMKRKEEYSFKVDWPLRPRSLSDFKLAVDALKHIATEKQIDEMSSTDQEKSKMAFRMFWRKLDPDTSNAFNPVMAEYYRRVDESIKRFCTSNEFDGYRTDRGRIYILFGAPTIINRLLKPNSAPTEIWTYEKLRQRYTFTDSKKNGNYVLIQTEKF